jgi:hypothetical protein
VLWAADLGVSLSFFFSIFPNKSAAPILVQKTSLISGGVAERLPHCGYQLNH